MDQFRRKQRVQRLLRASAPEPGPDTRPSFLITGIAGSATSGAPSAPAMAQPRVKVSHSPSPFDPVKKFNPVGFLDTVSVSSLDAGLASVEAYNARGYADGTSPYTSLWRNKVRLGVTDGFFTPAIPKSSRSNPSLLLPPHAPIAPSPAFSSTLAHSWHPVRTSYPAPPRSAKLLRTCKRPVPSASRASRPSAPWPTAPGPTARRWAAWRA